MREANERQTGVTVVIERMCYGIDYVQRTEAEYAEQERERVEKNLHRRAKELGYELTKVPRPPDTPIVDATPATSPASAKLIVDNPHSRKLLR